MNIFREWEKGTGVCGLGDAWLKGMCQGVCGTWLGTAKCPEKDCKEIGSWLKEREQCIESLKV